MNHQVRPANLRYNSPEKQRCPTGREVEKATELTGEELSKTKEAMMHKTGKTTISHSNI